jgi:hypothetical protein
LAQGGKNAAEFAVPDQGFTTDQRDVHGLVFADEVQHAFDQRITAQIIELTQGDSAAEVSIPVGITSGTTERTFASNLEREQRHSAA